MIEPAHFRQVLGQYPTGVCVITSIEADGRPVGLAVGSFTSVSLAPPLVAFFPDRRSTTWPRIEAAARFCVNVLGEHQEHLCRRFAAPATDKFAGLTHQSSKQGLPILDDVVAWIDCRLYAVHEAGDHFIAIGEVTSLGADPSKRPLVFHGGDYNRLSALSAAA